MFDLHAILIAGFIVIIYHLAGLKPHMRVVYSLLAVIVFLVLVIVLSIGFGWTVPRYLE